MAGEVRKRGAPILLSEERGNKRPRASKELASGHLFLNKLEVLPHAFNEQAFSLSELVERIRPILSLHFSFMIDIEWLMEQYPKSFSSYPMTLVVGKKMGSDSKWLTAEVSKRKLENVSVVGVDLPLPYGTHHSKLSLFESDKAIHVVISTSNLVPSDWETKTQLFYYTTGQLQDHEATTSSLLSADLLDYLNRYGKMPQLDYWKERLKYAKFEEHGDRLLFSTPGYHTGASMKQVGHLRLRSLLEAHRKAHSGLDTTSSSQASSTSSLSYGSQGETKLLVCQASSIGSLGGRPEAWMHGPFLSSLTAGGAAKNSRLMLVYPTEEDVRGSMIGLASGSSLPYSRATGEKQPWLISSMCKWRSERLGRSRAMPHVKTYCQFDSTTRQLEWMAVTSANLSKAAWGEEQKNGSQLMIRSFELGVLLFDRDRFLLPYDYPLCKYQKDDKPWYVDILHESLRE